MPPMEVAPLVACCDQGRLTLDVADLPKPFQGDDVDGDHVWCWLAYFFSNYGRDRGWLHQEIMQPAYVSIQARWVFLPLWGNHTTQPQVGENHRSLPTLNGIWESRVASTHNISRYIILYIPIIYLSPAFHRATHTLQEFVHKRLVETSPLRADKSRIEDQRTFSQFLSLPVLSFPTL